MFMHSYEHTVDGKGRIIVPSKYREELGENFVVTKGFDDCLNLYPMKAWEAFAAKLGSLPTNKKGRDLQRFFLANASEVELDKQGRALIPGNLREWAGISKNVIFVGMNKNVEIWDKDKWEENMSLQDAAEVSVQMEEYDLSF